MNNSSSSTSLQSYNQRKNSTDINDIKNPPSSSEVLVNENKGLMSTLLLAILAAITGTSFHFGYAIGVLNSPQNAIQQFINETGHRRDSHSNITESTSTLIFSFVVSIFAVGGMIGGLSGGLITNRFGPKGGMFLNNIISGIACILMFISKPIHSYEALIMGRFMIGLSCGYGTSVGPMYINEVSPRHLRGTLGVAFQLGVVFFIFFSQVITLESILGAEGRWHYALGLPIVFSITQVLLLSIAPESPKYLLLKKKDSAKAKKALGWLRNNSDLQQEISEIEKEENSEEKSAGIVDLFRTPTVRWALFITIFLHLSQQLSGINAVFYYSTIIFEGAGFDQEAAQYANLALGGAPIIVTIIIVFLMDRAGRRRLHLIGLGGMLISSLILVISLLAPSTNFWNKISLIMTILFVSIFAFGPGPIPWLITSELFSQTYRVPASSIASLVNWSANFVVGLAFKPLFTGALGKYTFLIFTVLLLIFFLLTYFFLPETKAKSVDTIYEELRAGQVWRKSPSAEQLKCAQTGEVKDGNTSLTI